MLDTLRIQNYALIDEVELEFRLGFNVLTGETGAGKSIVIGALNLVLGARASSDVVRSGAKQAKIDAVFRVPEPSRRLASLLQEHGIELDNGELYLGRTVSADGRSRGYAGGGIVPINVLAAIGDELVDLHGQHEHQSLLKTERQLELLDAFAGMEQATASVAEQVSALHALEHDIAELESGDRERARRIDFLRFEVDEINAAELEPDEEAELKARRNIIANAEKIHEAAARAYGLLYEGAEMPALDAVDEASRDIDDLAEIDDAFKPLAERLRQIRNDLDDVASEVREHTADIEFDPRELDTLNERLALIGGLKRKYGDTIEAILAYRDKGQEEIDGFEHRDQRLSQMRKDHEQRYGKARDEALALSKKRKSAARKLDKEVAAALQDLGMAGGRFETRFTEGELATTGIDRVAFHLSANPGQPLKPLKQVASGGEVSRIMLALKSTFAHADAIPTLIFDEIDAGVGGGVAKKVAAKMVELAKSHQTICITHLPQMAARAAHHYRVDKEDRNGQTRTTVARVEGDARTAELARLLDGSVSEVSLEHARALLKEQA